MANDLLHCPFCGSDEMMDMRYSGAAYVQCEGCNVSTEEYGSWQEAHSAWNLRVGAARQDAEQVRADEAESDAYTIQSMGRLLAEVAIALKGPEKALHRHGYQDLPELAAKMAMELGVYRVAAKPEGSQPSAGDREPVPYLQEQDQHDLHRFIETSEDDEGYDIPKDRMKRMADLGVVSSQGFGRYGVTAFGYWAHEHHWCQKPSLPLMTNSDRDAAARAQRAGKGDA